MLLLVTEGQDLIAAFSKLAQILECGIGAHRSFSNPVVRPSYFYGGKYHGAKFGIHDSGFLRVQDEAKTYPGAASTSASSLTF